MKTKNYSCIIIGAGPGGLVTTKELIENGINNIVCLERSGQLGGVFTKCYDKLQLTSSATFSMFSDFFNKDGEDNHFWSKKEALLYWKRYAEHFDVLKHIRFNTSVVQTSKNEDGKWVVTLQNGETLSCDRLIVATGNNGIEKYPQWSKELSDINYTHSKYYKNAQPFKGKRVLVVGGGESASDITLEISKVADKCWVSLRESTGWLVPRKRQGRAADVSTHRGLWGAPRKYGAYLTKKIIELEKSRNNSVFDTLVMLNSKITDPKGIWSTYGTKNIAIAEAIAQHGCQLIGEITKVDDKRRSLKTDDGAVLENVDFIVFSTGYKNHFGFLPEEFQSCDPRSLYKHMFHLKTQDSLAWIGVARPNFGSQFPVMEMQARLLALICAGKLQLPSIDKMQRSIDSDFNANKEQFGKNAERIRSLIDYLRYMDGLAEIIGCTPPLRKYFFLRPSLWFQLMYGPAQATQYRLKGPNNKNELARRILKKLPVSSFNHVVKLGIHIRLAQAIDALKMTSRTAQQ